MSIGVHVLGCMVSHLHAKLMRWAGLHIACHVLSAIACALQRRSLSWLRALRTR